MADPFLGQLEPLAESHLRDGSLSYEHALLASVAVSLKRIADLASAPAGMDLVLIGHNIKRIADNMDLVARGSRPND